MMDLVLETIVSIALLVGAFFLLMGSLGLAKLPDMMRRLHAPTKATTLGVGATLIASMTYFALLRGAPSAHEFLITVFLFLTAPVTAQMIAKAHILCASEAERGGIPWTGRPVGWATLDPAPADRLAEEALSTPLPGTPAKGEIV